MRIFTVEVGLVVVGNKFRNDTNVSVEWRTYSDMVNDILLRT